MTELGTVGHSSKIEACYCLRRFADLSCKNLDTPPDEVPADILDPYPLSYGNPQYRWRLAEHALIERDSSARPLLQGRVMGGGSSIMGMIMLRGTPADYDGRVGLGARGWGWHDVLPYFRKLEHDLDFGGDLHGSEGLTEIRRHRPDEWPPLATSGTCLPIT